MGGSLFFLFRMHSGLPFLAAGFPFLGEQFPKRSKDATPLPWVDPWFDFALSQFIVHSAFAQYIVGFGQRLSPPQLYLQICTNMGPLAVSFRERGTSSSGTFELVLATASFSEPFSDGRSSTVIGIMPACNESAQHYIEVALGCGGFAAQASWRLA